MREVTVVVTSFDRLDLLKDTIDSFNGANSYFIEKFIIIDDSDNREMHDEIRRLYPNYLILTEGHKGLVECIDQAYSLVTTPYVWHTEDDFHYEKGSFIEKGLVVLKSDKTLMSLGIRYREDLGGYPILPDILSAEGVEYQIAGESEGWYGFGFQCSLRSMESYNRVKPYLQWAPPDIFITWREQNLTECMLKHLKLQERLK